MTALGFRGVGVGSVQRNTDEERSVMNRRQLGLGAAVTALAEYYREGTYRECLEIIDAVANSQSPETVEFLSRIYNEQLEYAQNFDAAELLEIRQRASSALGKSIVWMGLVLLLGAVLSTLLVTGRLRFPRRR